MKVEETLSVVMKYVRGHAVAVSIAAAVTAGGLGYVAYQNSQDGQGENAGQVVSKEVAVSDKKGDVRMEVQGLKEDAVKEEKKEEKSAGAESKEGDLKRLEEALASANEEAKPEEAPAEEAN